MNELTPMKNADGYTASVIRLDPVRDFEQLSNRGVDVGEWSGVLEFHIVSSQWQFIARLDC
jgi:hypothetical protein